MEDIEKKIFGIIRQNAQKISLFWGLIEIDYYSKKLDNHPLFQEINAWITTRIGKSISDPIIRKFLLIKLKTWQDILIQITKYKNLQKLNNQDLYDYFKKQIENTTILYTAKWKEEENIPKDKIDSFNNLHSKRINIVLNQINHIIFSEYYPNFNSKMVAIFNAYLFVLNMTILHAEQCFSWKKS
ncbi:MAG TPA: hypothetical protein ENK88_03460 [Campylobacterales bacterium]|nr:hypothetical protein [Campylobacterales bacterium]